MKCLISLLLIYKIMPCKIKALHFSFWIKHFAISKAKPHNTCCTYICQSNWWTKTYSVVVSCHCVWFQQSNQYFLRSLTMCIYKTYQYCYWFTGNSPKMKDEKLKFSMSAVYKLFVWCLLVSQHSKLDWSASILQGLINNINGKLTFYM